jgi:integrase
MATVFIDKRKRKTRNSYIVYYKHPVSGKNKYHKTFHKQKEAQSEANKLRALIDTGKLPHEQIKRIKPVLFTVSEVGDSLLESWKLKLANKELSPITFDDYNLRLKQIKLSFKGKLACEIRKNDILKYRNQLAVSTSNATSNRYLFILKQVFNHAMVQGTIQDDPTEGISYLSEKEHERNKFILPAKINCLIDASQKTRAKFYMPSLIYLGAEHGSSRQESLSLQWPDIDFEYDGIGIIRFFRTKNKRERIEYLMPRTKKALLEWKAHLEYMRHRKKIQPVETRFVFCRLNGQPIKRFDSAWRQICNIANITDFHYHDLRHTFCSNLLLSGANIKDVKEMIGHSDISMTDRYSHLTLNHHKAIQEKLARHYENIAN